MCEFEEMLWVSSSTWTFDASTSNWTETTTTREQPLARVYHTAVLVRDTSTLKDYMLVYGGSSPLCALSQCGDVWQLDLSTTPPEWSEIEVSGASPGQREQHAATSFQGSMYVFGGVSFGTRLNDVWRFTWSTTRTWIRLRPTDDVFAPSPRSGHAAALVGRTWYISGGLYDRNVTDERTPTALTNDMWEFDLASHEWTERTVIDADTYIKPFHQAAMVAVSDVLIMFGGAANGEYQGTLLRFNVSAEPARWLPHPLHVSIIDVPEPRGSAMLAHMSARSTFYLYGGLGWGDDGVSESEKQDYFDGLWKFDTNECPDQCNGNGACLFGVCYCFDGFFNGDCQDKTCPGSVCTTIFSELRQECLHCTGTGDCIHGICRCHEGFKGVACENLSDDLL